jgi:DNA replication protein DnaC
MAPHEPLSSQLFTEDECYGPGKLPLASERLTGALLDRLTHHVHILEMNGESYRLKQSKHKRSPQADR